MMSEEEYLKGESPSLSNELLLLLCID